MDVALAWIQGHLEHGLVDVTNVKLSTLLVDIINGIPSEVIDSCMQQYVPGQLARTNQTHLCLNHGTTENYFDDPNNEGQVPTHASFSLVFKCTSTFVLNIYKGSHGINVLTDQHLIRTQLYFSTNREFGSNSSSVNLLISKSTCWVSC